MQRRDDWTKDVAYGAARNKEKRKTTQKVHGCTEGGHEEGWGDRGSRKGEGEMEADDLLWPPLKKSI